MPDTTSRTTGPGTTRLKAPSSDALANALAMARAATENATPGSHDANGLNTCEGMTRPTARLKTTVRFAAEETSHDYAGASDSGSDESDIPQTTMRRQVSTMSSKSRMRRIHSHASHTSHTSQGSAMSRARSWKPMFLVRSRSSVMAMRRRATIGRITQGKNTAPLVETRVTAAADVTRADSVKSERRGRTLFRSFGGGGARHRSRARAPRSAMRESFGGTWMRWQSSAGNAELGEGNAECGHNP